MQRRRTYAHVAAAMAMTLTVASAAAATAREATDTHLGGETACPTDRVGGRGFVDVGPPHDDAVECLSWYSIVNGTSLTTFDPREPVLRGQTATMIFAMMTRIETIVLPERDAGFSDVRGGPHDGSVATLASFEPAVLEGFDDGTFNPYDPVTRGQFASILVRALDEVAEQDHRYAPLPDATYGFDDATSGAHREAVARSSQAGISNGYADGTFRAGERISREQAASMIVRAMDGLAEAGVLRAPDGQPLG